MSKTAKKSKEPVTIRYKALKNGNQSIYLDIYNEGKRSYKFLKLYLIPVRTPLDKRQNKETMRTVNAIKSQMVVDLTYGKAKIEKHESKLLLHDVLEMYAKERAEKGQSLSRYRAIMATQIFVDAYKNGVKLSDVDKKFCKGFAEYLKTAKVLGGETMSKGTAKLYFSVLISVLNFAIKRGLIENNPIRLLDVDEKPKSESVKREFLTIDEVKKLIETPSNDKVKKPFLFGCFTGLRFGDIMSLCWSDIVEIDGKKFVSIQTEKTKKRVFIPIPNESVILPEKGCKSDKDSVFESVSNLYANKVVSNWTANAGINKYVTFHTSRHTYATLLLTQGADLYTVSKLLGHSEIKTTQIYAEIIDKKKEEAASLLNGLI